MQEREWVSATGSSQPRNGNGYPFIGLGSALDLEGPEEAAVSPGRLGKLQQQLRGTREE